MSVTLDRRRFLQVGGAGLGILGVGGFPQLARAMQGAVLPPISGSHGTAPLVPLRISADLITHITVCLRPFRRAGPRIEMEKLGHKTVVHNYGHGGSGWSLSWGSAEEALKLAMLVDAKYIAVIGAGAIGLTTALTAQRMGKEVTIYAKDRFPNVRSARATGTWSPDSRVAMVADIDEAFALRWEQMTKTSFAQYSTMVGRGNGVEITDRYFIGDDLPEQTTAIPEPASAEPVLPPQDEFAENLRDRMPRLFPRSEVIEGGMPPFATPYVRRGRSMTFNVAQLARQLTAEFIARGGKFVQKEFRTPSDVAKLRQAVIINCTGYGAAKLWNDKSLIPIRGQIGWMAAQPEALYGVVYHDVQLLGRRDGVAIQNYGTGMFEGYGVNDESPNPAETVDAIARLQGMWRET